MSTITLYRGEVEMSNVDKIAEKFGCNKETIRRYIRQGRIKAQKIGRSFYVSKASLIEFTNGGIIATRKNKK